MLRGGPLSTTSPPPAGYTLFTVSLGEDSSLGLLERLQHQRASPATCKHPPQTTEPTAEECANVGVGSFLLRAHLDQNMGLRCSSVPSAPGDGGGVWEVTMRAADRTGNDLSASMAKSVPPS